jgi:hypothetical protein
MLRHSVQHDQGKGVELTKGLWCLERGGGRPTARSCGSNARGDRGWAEVGLLQVCWSLKSKRTGPAEVLRGSTRPKARRRRAIGVAEAITDVCARFDSRRSRRSRPNCRLGETLDDEVDLLQGWRWPEVQRSSLTTEGRGDRSGKGRGGGTGDLRWRLGLGHR